MSGDILLVDDDPDLLKLISLRLTSAGYRVRTAESGETALAAREFAAARAQVAAARVHDAASAPAALLAARIAVAAGEDDRTLDLYTAALHPSRTLQAAFAQEAHAALGVRAAELDARLQADPPTDEAPPLEPARFRCEQCGVGSVTWHWRCPRCRSWDSLRSTQNRAL